MAGSRTAAIRDIVSLRPREDMGLARFALLRDYHEAVAGFPPPPATPWAIGSARRDPERSSRPGV